MVDITFDKFKQLSQFRYLTLEELSFLICGEKRLVGFLSKLSTHHPVSVANNFKEVAEFVAKHNYNLVLNSDYNKSLTMKDRRIKELESELEFYKNAYHQSQIELAAYKHVEQALNLLNTIKKDEILYKRPHKNRKVRK